MKYKFTFISICWIFLSCVKVFSQPNYFGGHKPSTKWEKLSNTNTNLFYPQGWKKSAIDVFQNIQWFNAAAASTSLGKQTVKTQIILQPFSTQSNGYVAYAPFKSELYLTANPDVYSQSSGNWLQQLTIHEYRHIQQYNAFRQYTIPKILYTLMGEYGLDFYGNLIMPSYFWEGDAVYHETRFTNAGRGRLHSFVNPFKEIFKHQHQYSWMQWRNGSMIKNIPNHYQLGYLMTSYGYEKYGDDFWKNISQDALRLKGLFNSFQKSFQSNYNISYKKFRTDALEYFQNQFQTNDSIITPNIDKFRSNQIWSYWLDDNKIVFLEQSYKKLAQFKIKEVHSGKVESLKYQWISNEKQFHYNNDKIVYTQYRTDPRWFWTTYQDIVLYDINRSSQHKITHHGKYFQPAINNAGDKIIAISQAKDINQLHILTKADRKWFVKPLENKDQYYYHQPRWVGKEIFALIHLENAKMSIAKIDTNGNHTLLFEPIYAQIGNFVIKNDSIFLNMNDINRDRLYLFTNNQFYVLEDQDSPANYYYFDIQNNQITYSNYHLEGLTVQHKALLSQQWVKTNIQQWKIPQNLFGFESRQTNQLDISKTDSLEQNLKYQRVHPLGSPFKIYNWMTTPTDTDELDIQVEGVNIINSLFAYVGLNHNFTTGLNKYNAGLGIGALFARLSLNTQYQTRGELFLPQNDSIVYSSAFKQNEWNVTASVPLAFYKKRTIRTLNASTSLGRISRTIDIPHQNYSYTSLRGQIQYFHYIPTAPNNIQTRAGLYLLARADQTMGDVRADRQAFIATAYLPGIGLNHALDLGYHFQQMNKNNQITLSEYITLARGFKQVYLHEVNKFVSNYHLPILYPDFGFTNIYFIQRLRAQMFYDYAGFTFYSNTGSRPVLKGNAQSAGVGLWLDGKIWNQQPLTIGFRYASPISNAFNLPFEKFSFSIPINL